MNTVNDTAAAWSRLGSIYAESAPHKFGPSLPKLLALARPGHGDICLDIGTGTGHTAAQLARFAAKVYGLDPSEGMRQAARESYGHLDALELVEGSSEATGFDDASFDIVTARHTLHHHPSMPRTLQELKRVLKPGGRLIIVDEITPSEDLDAWYHALEVTRDPTHVRAYFMREWRAFISEAGLKWIVGDTETYYKLDIAAWIARMKPTAEQAESVRRLFREATETARYVFNIVYSDAGEALSFEIPMALILAIKPEEDVQL